MNGNFAAGMAPGMSAAIRALGLGQSVREQAQLQSGLMSAQAAKAGQDAMEGARLANLRQDPNYLAELDAIQKGLGTLFKADYDVNKAPGGALDLQKLGWQQQVLQNIGNPGTDREKINQGTAVLFGKADEPYAAVGDTGFALNKATGRMVGGGMDALFPGAKGQVVDTPNGIMIVDPRTGQARPATGAGGSPVLGDKAQAKATKDRERNQEMIQADSALGSLSDSVGRLQDAAQEIMGSDDLWRITGAVGQLPSLPGQGAANLEAKLQNLKSQVGFAVLQAMRDASKTGGALGAISDKENELLQNNLAALSTKQSPEQFKTELQKIVDYAASIRDRSHQAYQQTYGQAPTLTKPRAPAAPAAQSVRTVTRRGNVNGRPVVQHSDGSIEYAE